MSSSNQSLTAWQVVEIVADESDARGELTVADKATVRWHGGDG
jgi:hypothetical protein